jgi:uncharacterized membrane protein
MRHRHPANIAQHEDRSFGLRAAGYVATQFGSWRFILLQTGVVGIWGSLNIVGLVYHWDPYPFILLNLLFSTQAAYAAPLILLSQNQMAEHDRLAAEHDYEVNVTDAEVNRQTLALLNQLHVDHTQQAAQHTELLVRLCDLVTECRNNADNPRKP